MIQCIKSYMVDLIGIDSFYVAMILSCFMLLTIPASLFLSFLVDKYGIKNTLTVNNFMGLIGFCLMSVFTNKYIVLLLVLGIIVPITTLFQIANRVAVGKYTLETARSFGFSIFYFVIILSNTISI